MILGNLDARKDWGYTKDFVEGMYKILQASTLEDFVLATGEQHTVREFVEEAFQVIGRKVEWIEEKVNGIGIDKKTKVTLVKVSNKFFRPIEA